MRNQVLNELKDIKNILAQLVGTADLQLEEQFSKEAIDKAAKVYQKLQIERGEWVGDSDISKFIRSAPYRPGSFLIKELGFTAYFRKGHNFYFQKKALQALAEELKQRNVNLARYIELKADQEKFKKTISKVSSSKGRKSKKPYEFPSDVKDITTSPIPVPSVELVREDLKRLKEEFFECKLSEYIDIYNGNHAMMKFIYHFEKYIKPEVKRRCKKWVDSFNYANHALELITKKKEIFVPVKEEDMYQL
ncbi:hypothetical protein OCK74_14935 [Chitinophagaceae bacterium LB-8]|uniref:Uncharacterized protein n=1 Tax=Paraflavisolibacter caeni TaxID=2982496 RepID=A0A9X2XW03_9BACT|nr:hypothetical protein [Paraflavisolibacter caeni]MCU7550414.1 hypothetical protein [Paraflavisolibacter caeni]